MSKEMAASLPVVIFLWNFCESWDVRISTYRRRFLLAARSASARDKWLYLAIALLIPAYAYYMVFIKGGSTRAGARGFDYWGGSIYTNILTAIRVHAWYLKQLVFPTPVVQYLGAFDIATTLADWRVVLSIIAVIAALSAGFVLLDRDRLMGFAVLSYFALLLPVSHIIPHHELLADHYLYLPLMSFGLLTGLVTHRVASGGGTLAKVAYAAAGAAILVLAVMTVLRNPIYKDNLTLWQENYREAPNSIRAVSSLAGVYANSNPQKAIDLYKKCVEIDPAYSPAYVSLAVMLQSREKAREAEQVILGGLALPDSEVVSIANPNPREFRSELTTALALARGNQGDNQEAERLLWEAIAINPSNPQPYTLLANFYRAKDRNKELDVLSKHLAVHPNSPQVLEDISHLLIEQKRFDEAVAYLERLLALDQNGFFANYNLGQIYRSKKECARARDFFLASRRGAATPEEGNAVEKAFGVLEQTCKQ
jgi:tetratricopeptide (TPR) repeat protein